MAVDTFKHMDKHGRRIRVRRVKVEIPKPVAGPYSAWPCDLKKGAVAVFDLSLCRDVAWFAAAPTGR